MFSISFSHDHSYLTLVLQRSVSSDIDAPIVRTGSPIARVNVYWFSARAVLSRCLALARYLGSKICRVNAVKLYHSSSYMDLPLIGRCGAIFHRMLSLLSESLASQGGSAYSLWSFHYEITCYNNSLYLPTRSTLRYYAKRNKIVTRFSDYKLPLPVWLQERFLRSPFFTFSLHGHII